ncbi:hypothetical protein Trydic_g3837 [Trypoxylus dichotomus]
MLRISWAEHVSNEEVYRGMEKDTGLVRRCGLLGNILQGESFGKRGPSQRRNSWLKNFRTRFSVTTTELFHVAANKVVIATIRRGRRRK